MEKRTLKTIILTLAILLVLLCGTTFALMFRQTDVLDNQFEPAYVSCTVAETFDGTTKSSIAVTNTSNIHAYLRVRVVSYWVDSNNKIVSKPSLIPVIDVAEGWEPGSDNTYYYTSAVAPKETTPNLLRKGITLQQEDGYLQVIEVFADAIQSEPIEAMTNSWNVTITNGNWVVP